MILTFKRKPLVLISLIFLSLYLLNCTAQNRTNQKGKPPIMLWAWERNEDLRFLNTTQFGVAFYAQTIRKSPDGLSLLPRRNELLVNPNTYLIAVSRIESSPNARFSEGDVEPTSDLIAQTLSKKRVREIQIDFDAVESERTAYRKLIQNLRQKLPINASISITALASWCASDDWLEDLPIDNAIPMLFDMGIDKNRIEQSLLGGKDWKPEICRNSYGLSVNQKLNSPLMPSRRIYYFNARNWRPSDTEQLKTQ